MADSVVIKLDGDDSGFKKTVEGLGDTAKESLDGLNDSLKETSDGLEKTGKSAKENSKGFTVLKGVISGLIANGLTALAGACKNAISSIANLASETREYREDINKLETAFTQAGFTTEQATKIYKDFYAVLGEEDRSVEAVNHLAKLVDTEKDLDTWTTICTGVWATFGDSLPIEGLTEAANETAKVGQVVGPLADALNWAGVNEDKFNESLKKCTSEQERQALITETLNDLYADTAAAYRVNNESIMEANRAQSDYTDTIAALGEKIEPVTTSVRQGFTDILNAILELSENIDFEAVAESINGMFQDFIDDTLPKIIDGFTWIKDNHEVITNGIIAIGAAFLAWKATSVITSMIDALKNATIAMRALNLAMASNPIGLVTMAVAALTSALVIFSTETDEATKEAQELSKEIQNLGAEYDRQKKSIDKTLQSEIAQIEKVGELRDRLFELEDQVKSGTLTEEESNLAKVEMQRIVGELNQAIPGLQLAIDSETGTLNQQKNAVVNLINAYLKLAEAKAKAAALNAKLDAAETQLRTAKDKMNSVQGVDAWSTVNPVSGDIILVPETKAEDTHDYKEAKKAAEAAEKDIADISNELNKLQVEINQSLEEENKAIAELGASGTNETKKQVGARTGAVSSGAKKQTKAVEDEAKKQFEASKKWIDEQKYYNNLTLEQELDAWQNLQSQYEAGSEERIEADREVYRVKQELDKQSFEHSKKWIEDRKYYNELSLAEELQAWQRVQSRYLEGTEERIEADREVYRVKQELDKQSFEHSKKWIEDRKYYNELSLAEELQAWQRVQSRYLEGTEERIEADREVYRIKKELTEEIERLESNYAKAVEDRAKQIVNSYGLFDAIGEKKDITGKELLGNLEDQVEEIETWTENLAELAARGIDEGLMAELQAMGPKASQEIEALLSLSDEDLEEYSSLFQKKYSLAKEQASIELEGLREETDGQIATLLEGVEEQFGRSPEIGKQMTDGLAQGILGGASDVINAAVRVVQQAIAAAQAAAGIQSPSKVFRYIGRMMGLGTKGGLEDSTDDIIQTANKQMGDIIDAYDGLSVEQQLKLKVGNLPDNFFAMGKSAGEQFYDGFKSMVAKLQNKSFGIHTQFALSGGGVGNPIPTDLNITVNVKAKDNTSALFSKFLTHTVEMEQRRVRG